MSDAALTSPAPMLVRHVEHVMGTAVSFVVHPGRLDRPDVRAALDLACARLHELDATFSTWKESSAIRRVQRGELAIVDAGSDVEDVVAACVHAREASDGWFDPWAIGGGFDPTGLVKGWAAQQALGLLVDAGVAGAMVNAGGDIATAGHPEPGRPWAIGIRDPSDATAVACRVASPGAVATSGNYERGEHIRNVRTGRSARALVSATVTGPDLALADALATALLAAGTPGLALLQPLPGFEAFVIEPDLTPRATPGFPFVLN